MVVYVKNKSAEAATGKSVLNMRRSYPIPSGLGKRDDSVDSLKKSHLCGVGIGNEALSRALGDSGLPGRVEFGLFQVFENFLGRVMIESGSPARRATWMPPLWSARPWRIFRNSGKI